MHRDEAILTRRLALCNGASRFCLVEDNSRCVFASLTRKETTMPFAATWNALRANLSAKTTIPNWTADKGLLGDQFSVVRISDTYVEVDPPSAQNVQKIPVKDFEAVYG